MHSQLGAAGAEAMTDHHPGLVAIVDDDVAILDSLKFLLELTGHTVAVYQSAAEFLANREESPACLILDHHMPQMTGLELADRLRRDSRDIPVLLITSVPSPTIIARAKELGVERVLAKPPAEDDLLGFVNRHA